MNSQLDVLYEDEHLLVLHKPSGMLTEGGESREDDLEQTATRMTGKPTWCCHRLDRLTSGVVLLRKSRRYKAELAALFETRQVRKLYWALVEGAWPKNLHRIESEIAPVGKGVWANVTSGGNPAVSTFQVLGQSSDRNLTWLSVLLKTGRTHQARLHCAKAEHPILGDSLYGAKSPAKLFGLHARELRFRHPATGEDLKLIAPPPANWSGTLTAIDREN